MGSFRKTLRAIFSTTRASKISKSFYSKKSIEASKEKTILLIEVKGARASDNAPTKKREHFDSGQIKTHFGKALVKILHEKSLNPIAKFAIAHPDDADIKKAIGHIIPFLKDLGIIHFWVSQNQVTED